MTSTRRATAPFLAALLIVTGCGGGSSGSGHAAPPATGDSTPPPAEEQAPTPPPSNGGSTPPPAVVGAPPAPSAPAPSAALSGAVMGINLNSVSYYSPEWAFVDLMKGAHMEVSGFPWMFVNPKGGSTPKVDADGYPVGLGSGQAATTLLYRSAGGHYPGGTYTVLFEGEGEVELTGDADSTRYVHGGQGTARFQVGVEPSDSGVTLRILASSASNHVRNIRVIMPGFEGTYAQQPFHPTFLARIRPFGVLRFMDWGETNHSDAVRWSDRKRPTYRTQYREGVAYEYMVQLCNTQGKHAWICVPHKADDDYVENLAKLLRDQLDPSLKLFVEYSNEVWNPGFTQHKDVNRWAGDHGTSWHVEYAKRSVEVFKTFERVFGGRSRLVRVLAAQAGSSSVAKRILAATPAGAADALAIAPYLGGSLGSSLASDARRWSVREVLDYCESDLERWKQKTAAHKTMADAAGLALIAYEGGQHLAAVGSNRDDSTLVNLFIAANRDARMGAIYRQYLADWAAGGGGVFCAFSSAYTPSKNGSWGALEYQDQSGAPKYEALVETANGWATSN